MSNVSLSPLTAHLVDKGFGLLVGDDGLAESVIDVIVEANHPSDEGAPRIEAGRVRSEEVPHMEPACPAWKDGRHGLEERKHLLSVIRLRPHRIPHRHAVQKRPCPRTPHHRIRMCHGFKSKQDLIGSGIKWKRMSEEVIFGVSSDLFQGYRRKVRRDEIESIEGVIEMIRGDLIRELERLHLGVLCEKLRYRRFHVHGYTLLDVLRSDQAEKVWYVCDHC